MEEGGWGKVRRVTSGQGSVAVGAERASRGSVTPARESDAVL